MNCALSESCNSVYELPSKQWFCPRRPVRASLCQTSTGCHLQTPQGRQCSLSVGRHANQPQLINHSDPTPLCTFSPLPAPAPAVTCSTHTSQVARTALSIYRRVVKDYPLLACHDLSWPLWGRELSLVWLALHFAAAAAASLMLMLLLPRCCCLAILLVGLAA